MFRKSLKKIKKEVQKVVEDQQVRSSIKQAVVGLLLGLLTEKIASLKTGKRTNGIIGLALTIGFNLVLPNRYKAVKTIGTIVIGAIAMRVKHQKERKQLAQEALVGV